MAEIMIQDVLMSICRIINSEFGYDCYVDEITQGFEEPCFFIETVQSSQDRIGSYRHRRNQQFCVHFFPVDDGEKNLSILRTIENLYALLECIRVGFDLCRGSGMNHSVEDGVLHFFVNYNYHLLVIPERDPTMEKLEHKANSYPVTIHKKT